MKTETLIHILETSVKRNGPEKPLTIGHLLNLVKIVQRMETNAEDRAQEEHAEIMKSLEP